MNGTTVTFYFGAASRYAYLAASQLDALAARTGARFEWQPLDVLLMFERRGVSPFSPPASGQYEAAWRERDAARWAACYGTPFFEPAGRLPLDMRLLTRACTAAALMGEGKAFGHSMMQRVFAVPDGRVDAVGCIELADACGLDAQVFAELMDHETCRQEVEKIAARAQTLGVFGVPSFAVGDDVFWGNDRLPLLERHLQSRMGD